MTKQFVKINDTFKHWFFSLPDWEKHTVRTVLEYNGNIEDMVREFEAGIKGIVELCAKDCKVGKHTNWKELYKHHAVPYMLYDLAINHEGESSRVQLGIEKSSLYVVITSMGKIEEGNENEDEYYEICDKKDDKGNWIKRFNGKVAEGISQSYTELNKPLTMGFLTLKKTLSQISRDTMGLREEENRIDEGYHPVYNNIYYGISETTRFFFILHAIMTSFRKFALGMDEEQTYFELALKWKKICKRIRELCEVNSNESDSEVMVAGFGREIRNLRDCKKVVRVLIQKEEDEPETRARGKKSGKLAWLESRRSKVVGESSRGKDVV